MASLVDICNSALNQLGASTIISLTENSKNARIISQRFDSVRDQVFREHPWNALTKRVKLAQDSQAPVYEFSFAYTLPSDCLKVLSFSDSTSEYLAKNDINYKIENGKLLTSSSVVYLKYISRETLSLIHI